MFVYVSNTMIPLRIAAIVANALFAAYFFLKGLYPLFALNAFLVPVNMLRLRQMRRLVSGHSRRRLEDFDFEWLRPYMKPLTLSEGFVLHRKGDLSEEAYLLVHGEIHLREPRRDAEARHALWRDGHVHQ